MRSAISSARLVATKRNVNPVASVKAYHRQQNQPLSHLAAQNYHNCIKRSQEEEDEKQRPTQYHQQLYPIRYNHHNNLQSRGYVTSTQPNSKSAPTLMLGLGAVAAVAKAGQYTVQAYNEWKETQPPPEEKAAEQDSKMNAEGKQQQQQEKAKENTSSSSSSSGNSTNKEGKRENIFASLFNMSVGSKYYEGGFDDKMTRREAALILGVRESSTPKRIKDSHRKLLILNHPDTGGSTYLAGKLNEAKELLLKGKSMR